MYKYIRYIIVVLSLIIIILLNSCINSSLKITGNLVSEKPDALSDLNLRLTIVDDNRPIETHKVDVNKNGKFEVQIKRKNLSKSGLLEIERWNTPPWMDPFISTDLRPFVLDPSQDEIKMGNVYITDAIDITGQKNNYVLKSLSEVEFGWKGFSFADFYSVAISKRDDRGGYILYMNSHNLKQAKFNYIEAQKYIVVNGNIPSSEFLKIGPFNRKSLPLEDGLYKLIVQAYVFDKQTGDIIQIGQTSDKNPFIFRIEKSE